MSDQIGPIRGETSGLLNGPQALAGVLMNSVFEFSVTPSSTEAAANPRKSWLPARFSKIQ
jgi:hypothetical protein